MMFQQMAAATTSSGLGPVWTTVLTLLGGAAAASLIGLLGAAIAAGRERRRWIREKRLAVYLELLEALEQDWLSVQQGKEIGGQPEGARSINAIVSEIRLLGPPKVYVQAGLAVTKLMEYSSKPDDSTIPDHLYDDLYRAMRRVIRVRS